jgi:hypothetical protein
MQDLIVEKKTKNCIRSMWKISIQKTHGDKITTLTTSKYPTLQQAKNAATQLRLISTGWEHAIRSRECVRPGAKPPMWRFHNYTVTLPVQEESAKRVN